MINIDYCLLSKIPIAITDKLYIYQHSMKEIEENIGYNHFEQIIFAATRETYEFKFQFENEGIDYKNLTYISLFFDLAFGEGLIDFKGIELCKTDRTIEVLNFLLNADFKIVQLDIDKKNIQDTYGLLDLKTNDIIYADNFYLLRNVLSKMLFIKKPKERFAKSQQAKELILRDMELKNKNNVDSDIYSIISSLLWSPNCKETHESIWNLTPYQIYNGYFTVEKIKNFDNIMGGYYHGTISSKDLNFKNIHWAKKND